VHIKNARFYFVLLLLFIYLFILLIIVFYRVSKYVFRMTYAPQSILLKIVYYHEPVDIFING